MNKHLVMACVAACAAAGSFAAHAASSDQNWVVHVGAHTVDPVSDSGRLAGMNSKVGSSTRPTFSAEYFFTPSLSLEVLAALPFKHDVRLDGARAVSVRELPPVVGVNYHFLPGSSVSPFLGAGVNYTHFYDAKGTGPLTGAHVELKDSWGLAAHGGVDVHINDRWMVTADLRWIQIRSKVSVGGERVGKARIDPLAYGLSVGYRF
ncbi:outer membrane protein [Luteibacter sp. Sphag1AF]|uniref:OmpW/AlkL family protein n=1 Tax=Luteibacter sp. Sphag1AF TaxID=2587031 RepID=UPI0017B9F621|nr:OmpW family outer membrane protein [Luteibacter sp. Sphag1AF]MBB3227639.1 outer membrane protein [Luteibacter sp. Sphag1AF]